MIFIFTYCYIVMFLFILNTIHKTKSWSTWEIVCGIFWPITITFALISDLCQKNKK